MQALRAADGLVKVGMGMSTGVAGTALKGIASIVAPTPVPPPAAALISPTHAVIAVAGAALVKYAASQRGRLSIGAPKAAPPKRAAAAPLPTAQPPLAVKIFFGVVAAIAAVLRLVRSKEGSSEEEPRPSGSTDLRRQTMDRRPPPAKTDRRQTASNESQAGKDALLRAKARMMRPPPEASDEDQLQWLADKKKSSGFENTIESPNLKWHGSGSWIARDRKPEETTLAEKAPETFAESVDRTVSELFSSGETNDTVGALPTGFKPVEKKEKRKSSLFPLWT